MADEGAHVVQMLHADPAQRQRWIAIGFERWHQRVHDRAAHRRADRKRARRFAAHRNGDVAFGEFAPCVAIAIAVGIARIDLFDIKIARRGRVVGDAPGGGAIAAPRSGLERRDVRLRRHRPRGRAGRIRTSSTAPRTAGADRRTGWRGHSRFGWRAAPSCCCRSHRPCRRRGGWWVRSKRRAARGSRMLRGSGRECAVPASAACARLRRRRCDRCDRSATTRCRVRSRRRRGW